MDGVWGSRAAEGSLARGGWFIAALWSLVASLLVTSSSPFPFPVTSWPPEGADGREILMGDGGSHPHFIQMAQAAAEAELRPAAGVARE